MEGHCALKQLLDDGERCLLASIECGQALTQAPGINRPDAASFWW